MGVFKLAGMTVKGLFSKAPTRKYPYEKREPFERTRGGIAMIDVKKCIMCGICAKKCPANAIAVDKAAETWTHWPYKCIACSACVDACPKNDIEVERHYPPVTTCPQPIVCKPEWTEEELAEKARIAAEKKAKAEAARAAKAAKAAAAKEAAAADVPVDGSDAKE